MYQVEIRENEAGQRLDKFLHKFMPLAPSSFFYKMLRKKNITLNGKKAEGKEKLSIGDTLSFYLSEETMKGFQKENELHNKSIYNEYEKAFKELEGILILYEDPHVIIMNKPAGILSQKAKPEDVSLNEWMIGYLLAGGFNNAQQLSTFKPSICNRLDRNTAGIVIGAKTLAGSQKMNELISKRCIRKFYRMLVKGHVQKEETLEGYLLKDEKSNKVRLVKKEESGKASYIKTRYYPIREFVDRTLVEAELITGKTHQIRVHLASTGHPLLGDYKYGDRKWNDKYKGLYHINSQLLYASRLEFPKLKMPFDRLSALVIEAPVPETFLKLNSIP